jgi:hypothetical protein
MNLWRRYLDDSGYEPTIGIIGVDPGGTTGIFSAMIIENNDIGQTGTLTTAYQVARRDQPDVHVGYMIKSMKDCGIPANRMHVAIEKYVITKRTAKLTQQPDALEVTGSVRAMAEKLGAHTWQFTPSNAKKFASDDLLDRIGWVTKRGRRQRHARDAARQAWSCLAEVDFPSWETIWSTDTTTIDGDELIEVTMDEIMLAGREDDDDDVR